MKHLKKTVAAGVLGVALLAGTATTFATWQNSDSIQAGTINTGHLEVTLHPVGGWNNDQAPWNNFRNNLSDYTFVPGMAVRARMSGNVEAPGFTMDQVSLSTVISGSEEYPINEDGYIVIDGQASNLRVTLGWNAFNRPGVTVDGQLLQDIVVTFERSSDNGMYDNQLENIAVDGVTVTVTQN